MSFADATLTRADKVGSKLDAVRHIHAVDQLPGQATGDRFGQPGRHTGEQRIRHVIT